MLPVKWQDQQPVILPDGEVVPYFVEKSAEQLRLERKSRQKGTDFYHPGPLWTKKGLSDAALFIRNPAGGFWQVDNKGRLHLIPKETGIHELANPAFIGQRITSWTFTATASMNFIPAAPHEFAGIVCFQNEAHYIQFGKTVDASTGLPMLLLEAVKGGRSISRDSAALTGAAMQGRLLLRVTAEVPDAYVFSFSADKGRTWTQVGPPQDATLLSTRVASGFQGATVGVYATRQ